MKGTAEDEMVRIASLTQQAQETVEGRRAWCATGQGVAIGRQKLETIKKLLIVI